MTKPQLLLALALCIASWLALGDEPNPRRRVWADSTGQFRNEAEFASATATMVKLKRVDSRIVIEVPLARFNAVDLGIVRQLAPDVSDGGAAPAKRYESAPDLESAAQKRWYAVDPLN